MDDPFFVEAEKKFYEKSVNPRVVRVIKHQTGHTNLPIDRKIKALQAGKRISKAGKIYYETRKNRTDIFPKKRV